MSKTPETDAVESHADSERAILSHARKLEQQRDALAEALDACTKELNLCMDCGTLTPDSPTRAVYEKARSALAAVRGK